MRNIENSTFGRRVASVSLILSSLVPVVACAETQAGPVGSFGAEVTEGHLISNDSFLELSYAPVDNPDDKESIVCVGNQSVQVAEGDTLIGIAGEVGYIWSDPNIPNAHDEAVALAIAALNNFDDTNTIFAGEVIQVPLYCDSGAVVDGQLVTE